MRPSPPNYQELSDDGLGVLYAQGIGEAFQELWARHEEEFLRIVRKRLRGYPEYDPEDMVQEAKLRLLNRAGQFSPKCGQWVRWASVVIKHLCQDTVRSTLRRPHQTPLPPTLAARETSSDEDLMEICDAALAKVPEAQKRVFVESVFRGRSQTEIAKEMRLSNATVSRYLESARTAVIHDLTACGREDQP